MTSSWPLAGDDHPIAEHNAWITPHFLIHNGTAAGYDPYFMAGYPKSLLSSPSSTLFEIVSLVTGGRSPIFVHKLVTLLGLASLPWLLMAAITLFRFGQGSSIASVALLELYIWTDGGGAGFPTNFARYGMVAYMVAVPLGLVAMAAFGRFLEFGGFRRWMLATVLCSLCFLLHVTSVLILAPAGLALLIWAIVARKPKGVMTYISVVLMALTVVTVNAFWWIPLIYLRSMSSEGNPFFTNPDVLNRMAGLIGLRKPGELLEPTIQAVILGLATYGAAVLSQKDRMATVGLLGFGISGFFWGYLAGYWPALNFLQPGRQTYALYTSGAALAGVGMADLGGRIRNASSKRLLLCAIVATGLMGSRVFLPDLIKWVGVRWKYPFLGSRTEPPHLDSIVKWVRANVKPGERLYYEECGEDIPGQPSPFGAGRYSGLLPEMTGVEVVGGFYLYVGLKTNFTQIGEKDKKPSLFGGEWSRERFVRYAKLYRPSAILCWTEEAKQFCRLNPDLIEVSFHDGRILGGLVKGFGGSAIRGQASVTASADRLAISGMVPDLDGLIVLRYHFVPGLRSRFPSVRLEPVLLEEDPVPFIGLRPSTGQSTTELDLVFPPGR